MRKYGALGLMVWLGLMCSPARFGQLHKPEAPKARYEITFDFISWDFGPVKKGETRTKTVPFTNTGTAPVTIEFMSACDCTSFTFPEEPLTPGEKGQLEITFDSAQKEVNETISIQLLLKEKDPETGYQIVYELKYTYELVQ